MGRMRAPGAPAETPVVRIRPVARTSPLRRAARGGKTGDGERVEQALRRRRGRPVPPGHGCACRAKTIFAILLENADESATIPKWHLQLRSRQAQFEHAPTSVAARPGAHPTAPPRRRGSPSEPTDWLGPLRSPEGGAALRGSTAASEPRRRRRRDADDSFLRARSRAGSCAHPLRSAAGWMRESGGRRPERERLQQNRAANRRGPSRATR